LLAEESGPYNSWGNGSAMRVSPVGWAFNSAQEVLAEAEASAAVSHNHPEGIKGAQALALAVFLARSGTRKEQMRAELATRFDYDLGRTVAQIRPGYRFDVSCQGSVPEALVAFFDGEGVEEAIRLAVSLGGDSDTLASMAGAVAHAYYGGMPQQMVDEIRRRLPPELWAVVDDFCRHYTVPIE
jgi:ADP-ribosylglycohydrolase